jgi:hypothetical protein
VVINCSISCCVAASKVALNHCFALSSISLIFKYKLWY